MNSDELEQMVLNSLVRLGADEVKKKELSAEELADKVARVMKLEKEAENRITAADLTDVGTSLKREGKRHNDRIVPRGIRGNTKNYIRAIHEDRELKPWIEPEGQPQSRNVGPKDRRGSHYNGNRVSSSGMDVDRGSSGSSVRYGVPKEEWDEKYEK